MIKLKYITVTYQNGVIDKNLDIEATLQSICDWINSQEDAQEEISQLGETLAEYNKNNRAKGNSIYKILPEEIDKLTKLVKRNVEIENGDWEEHDRKVRDILRFTEQLQFEGDKYNILKDRLFFKIAQLLHD